MGLWLTSAAQVHAQWTTQVISLRAGWNAVYLEVQPEPRAIEHVVGNLPVESVWMWNRRVAPVEFIQDPRELVPPQPDWLVYVNNGHPFAGQRNLHTLLGGRSYLVKLRAGSPTTDWTVKGKPSLRRPDWLLDSYNFAGFSLPPDSTSTFGSFFGGSVAQRSGPFHRLNASGAWVPVADPANTPLQRGESFWVMSRGPSDFAGPLDVTVEQQRAVNFGRTLVEQTVRIRNRSASAMSLALRVLPSDSTPTDAQAPIVAGSVPLDYWRDDFEGREVGWANLSGTLTRSSVPAGGEWVLRLAVRRRDMPRYTGAIGASGASYQAILEVSDAARSVRQLVPVTSDGLYEYGASGAAGGRRSLASPPVEVSPRAGLWVGSVSITNVSEPSGVNPSLPTPTTSEFQFRVLLHVDATGNARFLQKVLQMWQDGTYKEVPDVINPQRKVKVVDVPGRYVLVTDDRLIPEFKGAALRDGQPVGRRFSTAAFAFREPIPMTAEGEFGADGSKVVCPVVLRHDDPLNPFIHRYHPDHNNKDERFGDLPTHDGPAGPDTSESFTIRREVELTFGQQLSDGISVGDGDRRLLGRYRETIVGLHKNMLYMSGPFELHHASRIPVLNDGR